MILVAHGAFDPKGDPKCGMSVLAARLRHENPEHEVIELNHHEEPDFLRLPSVWIGYSNGFDLVLSTLEKLWLSEPNYKTDVVGIDGVHEGGGFMASPWILSPNIRTCLYFLRTRIVGIPPWHQTIANSLEPIIPIDADHGTIAELPEVHNLISQRVRELLQ